MIDLSLTLTKLIFYMYVRIYNECMICTYVHTPDITFVFKFTS